MARSYTEVLKGLFDTMFLPSQESKIGLSQ